HIARYTAQDPAAGLPDEALLAKGDMPPLDLHHPWSLSTEDAAALAVRAERAAGVVSPLITNTEGASVDTYEGHFVLANTRGFMGGYPYTRHGLSVSPIAAHGDQMQRDYWYTAARDWRSLASPEAVGQYAARRTLSRLSARRSPTGRFPVLFEAPGARGLRAALGSPEAAGTYAACRTRPASSARRIPAGRFPVVFEAPLALGLLGGLVQAVSGGALYRKASFLLDSLGKRVMADHLDVHEDPHV